MDLAPHAAGPRALGFPLRGGDPGQQAGRGPVTGAGHPQHSGDAGADQLVERRAAGHLGHPARHDQADVRVEVGPADRRGDGRVQHGGQAGGRVGVRQLQVDAPGGLEPGRVGQQAAQGDPRVGPGSQAATGSSRPSSPSSTSDTMAAVVNSLLIEARSKTEPRRAGGLSSASVNAASCSGSARRRPGRHDGAVHGDQRDRRRAHPGHGVRQDRVQPIGHSPHPRTSRERTRSRPPQPLGARQGGAIRSAP